MKKLLAVLMLGLITVGSFTGCNTTEGVGEDLEEVGNELQNT